MLKSFDAVFFDAGMTLLEPTTPIDDAYLSGARRIGVHIDRQAFVDHHASVWRFVNEKYRSATPDLLSSDALEREAWRQLTAEAARPFPELAARHESWLSELERWFDSPGAWRVADGAEAILKALRSQGVICGVVSNWHTALHAILRGHGIHDHFDFVLTSAEAGRKKPHQEIFRQAIARAGRDPARTAHVGDSLRDDAHGALDAGLVPIWLSSAEAEIDPRIKRVRAFRDLLPLE